MAELTPSLTRQPELPLVKVQGKPLERLPEDLFIPPEALEVFLETFEGPLDLLLYLIKRQNIDILQVDMARLATQYVAYVEAMRELRLELAADYLVMAAMLTEIKSRALLPVVKADDDEEVDDPRAELIARLQEYERIVKGAEHIRERPSKGVDFFQARIQPPGEISKALPELDLAELLSCLADVLRRESYKEAHQVSRETLSTRERMSIILEQLNDSSFVTFESLLSEAEGRAGVVVSFLATLELIKSGLVDLVHEGEYAPLHLKLREEAA